MLVDHTAKKVGDDAWAITSRGSSVKDDDVDFIVFCDAYAGKGKTLRPTTWTRTTNGHVHLRIAKPHRFGHIAGDAAAMLATVNGYHDPALGGVLRITFDEPAAADTSSEPSEEVAERIENDHDRERVGECRAGAQQAGPPHECHGQQPSQGSSCIARLVAEGKRDPCTTRARYWHPDHAPDADVIPLRPLTGGNTMKDRAPGCALPCP